MSFETDEDPNRIQKIQINETMRVIQQQERIIKKFEKSVNDLYSIMTGYHPPDADLKQFYDRYLVISSLLKSLIADIKIYNTQNYTEYAELDPITNLDPDKSE